MSILSPSVFPRPKQHFSGNVAVVAVGFDVITSAGLALAPERWRLPDKFHLHVLVVVGLFPDFSPVRFG